MIYQWIYSYSCWYRQKRISDARPRGFATFSWSNGLNIEEIDELERRCSGYRYPMDDNIPPSPSKEEIDKFLPIAFYSFTLASGRRAIVRTRYIGDGFYDKRSGAIISHGLILDKGEDWPSYPMAYFNSTIFWNELPLVVREKALEYKDREDSPQPEYLPVLETEDFKPQGKYTLAGVAAKIAESEKFCKMLATLMKAYITKTDAETLYISAPHDDIPWLFAGLTMAFPMEMSVNLSFSTYLSDKIPAENEIGRWYQVAATEKRYCSLDLDEIPSNVEDFICYVNTLFTDRKLLEEFLQDFTGLETVDMPCVVSLFRFLRKDIPLSAESAQTVQELLLEHGNRNIRKEFLEVLISGRGLPERLDEKWFEKIFTLVSDSDELRPLNYDLFLKQKCRYQGDPLEFFVKVAERYPREITTLWLEKYSLKDLSTTGLMFSFTSLSKNGIAKELDTSAWTKLFDEDTKEKVAWDKILERAPYVFPECFVAILARCPDARMREKTLENIVQDIDETVGFARKALAQGETGITKEILKKYFLSERKITFNEFKQIVISIETVDSIFIRKNFGDLFTYIKDKVKIIDRDSLVWLLGWRENVPSSDVETFLRIINSAITFPDDKDPAYLEILEKILSDNIGENFRTMRIGFITWFLKKLEDKRKPKEDYGRVLDTLITFESVYRTLAIEEQMIVCDNLLPIVIHECDGESENVILAHHRDALMFFGVPAPKQTCEWLAKRYVELVSQNIRKNNILLRNVCFLSGIKCALGKLDYGNLRKQILAEFQQQVLRKFSNDELKSIKEKLGILTIAETQHWNELLEKLQASKTFVARLKSFLTNIFNRKMKGK